MIFRDDDLYTIDISSYNENKSDDGYGFYYDLENDMNNTNNDLFYEREIKYNKKIVEQQIKNDMIKHFENKYKQYIDYCMFGLIVFSCSMLLFQDS